MSSVALAHVSQARKKWRMDPAFGFYARPKKNADGTLNLMVWECGIPGKPNTSWAGGLYKLEMKFGNDFPHNPPQCQFVPPLFHPNVFGSGQVCHGVLVAGLGWHPNVSIKQILLDLQTLLDEPNTQHPVRPEAYEMYMNNRDDYEQRVYDQADALRR